MADHGHDNCPHCEHQLEGLEPVCPKCEGDLFGVPPMRQIVKEKVSEMAQKVESEVRDVIANVSEHGSQSIQKANQQIGEHVIPVFSNVKDAGSNAVERVKERVKRASDNDNTPDEEGNSAEEDTWTESTSDDSMSTNHESTETDLESMINEGELLVSEGKEQQAMKIFNQVIATDPSNGMAWFNRGVIHEMNGQVEEATKAFKVCLDMQPDHGPAAANLAVLLDRTGDGSEAAKFAHRALKGFPSHPELTRISTQGPAEEAAAPDVAVVAAEPTPAVVEEVVQSVPQPVAEAMPAVVEENTLDLDSIVEDAANMVKQNRPEDALESLRELLHNEASEHPRAWRIAAAAMARLSLVDNAIEAFTYALDLDNTDAASWYNLGALHRRNNHEETAVTCFDAALGLKPDYTKASAALAEIHTANGSLPSAIEAWRALLSYQPDHAGGVEFAGILIAIAEGEGEVLEMASELPTTIPEGPELANEALNYIPDNNLPENVMLMARAQTLTSSFPEAVKAWRALIENDRENAELWRGMMKTFIAAGDQQTAEKCRAKIASLTGEEAATPVEEVPSLTVASAALTVDEPIPDEEEVSEPTPESVLEEVVAPAVEEVVETVPQEDDDPWGNAWGDEEDTTAAEAEQTPEVEEVAPEEITAAESVLDNTPEPEESSPSESSEEVNLAKAALDAQMISAQHVEERGGQIDSSSISNQDVQWYNKGLTLLSDEKYQEALSCFDRALPTFVNDDEMIVRILNARGNAFYYLKNFGECIDAYHKAMKVNPSGVTGATLYNMGTAYAEVERYNDAIKCFENGMSEKRVKPLEGDQAKMAKEQIRRCKLLLKEQDKKLKRLSRLQG